MMNRRDFLRSAGLAGASLLSGGLAGCAGSGVKDAHVVIVGGGYGGATAAKYLRMWSQGAVNVTLVERNTRFVSCPLSNLVVSGDKTLADITLGYDGLRKWGVRIVHDEVTGIDTAKRRVRLAGKDELAYDRLLLSPGVDFMWEQVPGLAGNENTLLHAWKAGPQTVALQKQLQDMKDGGTYAIAIPKAPYRCPPGPYERACLVADYFKRNKPRSRVVVLDANQDIISKKALFTTAFASYRGILEYRPDSELREVDAASRTAILEFDQLKADVLNVVPPQKAGHIAYATGLKLINNRWVDIDWLSMEAVGTPGVHVIGDAVFPAPTMPKSAHMANQHAKLAAAAILNLLAGEAPNPEPVATNTCYSFVDSHNAIHVASVHRYDAAKATLLPVPGAGGVSAAASEIEGGYALAWAKNIWADTLA
ncbi:MAG: FAD-dependent oxidoreductase [Zoogloea sp.]|nr:FAD-dependent oxidoreductase [Zoogloea sp.]